MPSRVETWWRVSQASAIADMTIMFDNSRDLGQAFTLARVQRGRKLLFDCRDTKCHVSRELRAVAGVWLNRVAGPWRDGVANSP